MKDVMGINIVFTEGYGLKNIYPDALWFSSEYEGLL
jgi:hypothetical protein